MPAPSAAIINAPNQSFWALYIERNQENKHERLEFNLSPALRPYKENRMFCNQGLESETFCYKNLNFLLTIMFSLGLYAGQRLGV